MPDKDGKKKAKPKPVKVWPFPRDMASDFAMLEAKSDSIKEKKMEVMRLVEIIEKEEALASKMANSAWDQLKESSVDDYPDDEKLLFSCAGLYIVTDEKLNIRTHVKAYMPDGAPEELLDIDDAFKVDLRLQEEGTDDKTGAASGPQTTNAEEIFKKKYWREEHGEEEKPEIPDELPEDMHLDDDE